MGLRGFLQSMILKPLKRIKKGQTSSGKLKKGEYDDLRMKEEMT
jgi:hypothetical protein